MRVLRVFLFSGAAVVLLLVGAVFLLPHVTDIGVLKKDLAEVLSQSVGREVRIDGEFRVALFPTPGLQVGGLAVSEPGGFEQGTMMQCGYLHAGVDLFALVDRTVSVDRIDIEDFSATFRRDAQGHADWDDLFPGDADTNGTASADDSASVSSRPGGIRFSVDRPDIHVRNSTLTMQDDRAGIEWGLSNSDLSLNGDDRRYELGTVFTARRVPVPVNVRARGVLDGGLIEGAAVLRDTRLTLDWDPDGPGGIDPAEVSADLVMDVYRGNVNATGIKIAGPRISATGEVRAEDIYDKWAAQGAWRISASDVGGFCLAHGLPVPAFADKPSPVRAGAEFNLAASLNEVALTNASLSFSDTHFRGALKAQYGNRTWFSVNGTADYLDYTELELRRPGNMTASGNATRSAEVSSEKDRPFDGDFDLKVRKFKAGKLLGHNLILDADMHSGQVKVRRFNADFERGGLEGSGTGTFRPGRLDAEIDYSMHGLQKGRKTGKFKPLMSGSLSLRRNRDGASGHVHLRPFDPRDVIWSLNMEWPAEINPHAVSKLEGSFDFRGVPGQWLASNIEINVDQTRLKGRVKRSRGGNPAFDFTLRANSLNLDSLLSTPDTKPQNKKKAASENGFSWLHEANFKGEVQIGRLVAEKESFKNVRGVLRAEKSTLTLNKGAAEWADGKASADLNLVLDGKIPAYTGKVIVSGLPAGSLLQALGVSVPTEARAEGRCDVSIKGSARGATREALLKSLDADVDIGSDKISWLEGKDQEEAFGLSSVRTVFGVGAGRGGNRSVPAMNSETATGTTQAKKQASRKETGLTTGTTFSLTAGEARMDGEKLRKFSAGGKLNGEFNADGELVSLLVSRLSVQGVPETFQDSHSPVTLSLAGHADLKESLGEITQADISGPGFTAHARAQGTWGDDWSVKGDLSLPEAHPAELWTVLYGKEPRKSELQTGSVNIGFAKQAGKPADIDLRLGVDNGTLMGRFQVRDFSMPDMDFRVEAHNLNFDRWTEPESNETDEPDAGVHWADEVFPMSWFRRPTMHGSLKLNDTRALGVLWGRADMSFQGQLGRWEVRVDDPDLYGGHGTLWLRVRAGREDLSAEASVGMKGVESGGFIYGLADDTILRGPVDMTLAASSSGNTWRTLAKNLAGKSDLTFVKGAVIPLAQAGKRREIPFDSMTGHVDIAGGMLRNDDMRASAAAYAVTGSGYLNLPAAYLDYTVDARGPAIAVVPISIKGPLTDVNVDVSSLGIFMDSLGRVMSLPLQPLYYLRDLLF